MATWRFVQEQLLWKTEIRAAWQWEGRMNRLWQEETMIWLCNDVLEEASVWSNCSDLLEIPASHVWVPHSSPSFCFWSSFLMYILERRKIVVQILKSLLSTKETWNGFLAFVFGLVQILLFGGKWKVNQLKEDLCISFLFLAFK